MIKIGIIILNYKRYKLSVNLISQLKKIKTSFFYHILLVDNQSPNSSFQKFQNLYSNDPQITLLQTKINSGFSGGVNFGLNHLINKRFDYALIINNDVDITTNFITELLKPFKKNPKLAITGPKIYFKKGFEYHKDLYKNNELGRVIWSVGGIIDWKNIYGQNKGIDEVDNGQYNSINTQIDFLSGCCLLINLKILKQVGLFDDNFFMYMEDCDLCQRVKKAGYQIAYIPKSIIYHYNAKSSHAGGDLQQYFLSRNRLLFAKKHANFRTNFALFRQSISTLLFGKYIWQKRGTLDFYLNKLAKGRWQ